MSSPSTERGTGMSSKTRGGAQESFVRRASLPPEERQPRRQTIAKPKTDDVLYAAEDDPRLYPQRPNTSIVRLDRPPVPAKYQTRVTEQKPKSKWSVSFNRFCFYCCVVLVAGITIAMLWNGIAVPRLTTWHDDTTYGYPRTIKVSARCPNPSQTCEYIGINLHGAIEVIVLPEKPSESVKPQVYSIAHLTGAQPNGEQQDEVPITDITFIDMNTDGKTDMLITVSGNLYVLYNTGTEYQLQKPQ